jgi:hypothetical protein
VTVLLYSTFVTVWYISYLVASIPDWNNDYVEASIPGYSGGHKEPSIRDRYNIYIGASKFD